MKFSAKLFVSTMLLTLTMAFSVDALATGNHDWDNDNGHDGWGDDSDRDWGNDWDGSWKKDWDDWKKWGWGTSHGSKLFVCHRTSSSKNPWVLIQISSSAKNTHYGHGDPVQFSDRGNGKCGPSGSTPDPTANLNLAADEIFVGATTTATWTSTNATSCKLNNTTVALSGSAPVGPYSSTGNKTVTLTCTSARGSDTDTETLKVKSAPPPPEPTVNLSLAADEIAIGATTTATWTSTNATSCKLNGSTTVAVSGSAPVGPYSSSGYKTISISCTGAGGSDSDSETLKVKTAPAPNVSLSVADYVYVGETTNATWTSSNATECKLGSTVVALNGSAPVGPYSSTGNKTVTITCTGPGGSDSDSETVQVKNPPPAAPVVNVTLEPSQILVNTQKAKLSWSSTGATSCKLYGTGNLYSDNWVVSIGLSGSYMKGTFSRTGQEVYTIKCEGPGGTTSESVTLTVVSASAPAVTLSLAATTIDTGAQTTATWTIANANSCTFNNGVSSATVSATTSPGSAQVGPFSTTGDRTVSISCTGPGSTTPVTASAVVKVVAPAPAVVVTLNLAASTIETGAQTTATWTIENATACTFNDGATSASVSATTSPGTGTVGPFSTTGDRTVSISCTGPGSTTPVAATALLTVVAPPPPPPSVTLSLAASTIDTGATTTATWTIANATACTFNNGTTSTSVSATTSPASGSVGPFSTTGDRTVSISCTGPGSTTPVAATALLTVVAAPPVDPTATLELTSIQLVQNTGTTTATWTANDATSCTIDGTDVGTAGGTANVGPYSTLGTQTVTLFCEGASGTTPVTVAKTLTVIEPPAKPTITFTVDKEEIFILTGMATATWTTTNATSCTLGDDSVGTAGSETMGPYPTLGKRYLTLSCIGPGGTAQATVDVDVVVVPPPPVQICASSTLGGGGSVTWVVNYNLTTGSFSGTSPDGAPLSGVVSPAFPYVAAGLVNLVQFTDGNTITVTSADVSGYNRAGQVSDGNNMIGPDGQSLFFIAVYKWNPTTQQEVFQRNTTIRLHGSCPDLPDI